MVKGVTSVHFFFLPPLKIKIILRNPLLGKAVQTLENPFQRLFVDLGKGRPQRLSPACRWRFCGEGGLGEVALRGRRTPPCPCSVHSGCTSWPELRPGGRSSRHLGGAGRPACRLQLGHRLGRWRPSGASERQGRGGFPLPGRADRASGPEAGSRSLLGQDSPACPSSSPLLEIVSTQFNGNIQYSVSKNKNL